MSKMIRVYQVAFFARPLQPEGDKEKLHQT